MNILTKESEQLKIDEVSLESLCSQLSISVATGKNWIRLGKIKPKSKGNIIYFNQGYIDKLKNEISKEDNKVLKSRRNKKYVSGNMLYKSYVGANSVNLVSVNSILDLINQNDITITNDLIRCLIYDCAIQLILSKYKKNQCISSAFESFLKDEISIDKFDNLFEFNDNDKKVYLGIINKYRELFETNYCFEENNDILGLIYISLKNIGERKVTGTYYTPEKIVKKLNSKLFEDEELKNKKILDPCCGTGNFLLNLPSGIKFSQIYASDIDEESIPVSEAVKDFAKLMGTDVMYMGNEGKMVLTLPAEYSAKAPCIAPPDPFFRHYPVGRQRFPGDAGGRSGLCYGHSSHGNPDGLPIVRHARGRIQPRHERASGKPF